MDERKKPKNVDMEIPIMVEFDEKPLYKINRNVKVAHYPLALVP
jgi:hypothetical protein